MSDAENQLPKKAAEALEAIPQALTPRVIKALDRLVGAAVDIPTAWLEQQKAKIEAKTEAYKIVEAGIAHSVASEAGRDPEILERAKEALVRKEYRKQINREAVAAAMVEDMREQAEEAAEVPDGSQAAGALDDDWLNVFERYAEDASSQRLQDLWGRVLAGEIRRPGRFSTRTLGFLSEFSQADALLFEDFAKNAFCDQAPKASVVPESGENIGHLVQLEASGLIQGASGIGFTKTHVFDSSGRTFLREGKVVIVLVGEPEKKFKFEVILVTPMGQELLALLKGRDPRQAARTVAQAIRRPEIAEAYLAVVPPEGGNLRMMEVLWRREDPDSPPVDENPK